MGEKGSQERFQGFCVTFYILLIHYLRKMYPSPSKFQVLEGSLVVCLKKSSHPLMMVSTHTPFSSVQFSSVAQSCPTLRDPVKHSTPGLPVHHQLPKFTQTLVHRVGDAIQPSDPLSSPSPPAPNPSQHQGLVP